MGCFSSKGTRHDSNFRDRKFKKSSKRLIGSSRTEEVAVEEVDGGINDVTTLLISMEPAEKSAGSTPSAREERVENAVHFDKSKLPQMQRPKAMDAEVSGEQPQMTRLFTVRNGIDVGQVIAGWPPWLSAVAGEAIKGWVPRKADSFEKLDKIGQGTYSSVYRARDLETGKIVALKKVHFITMDPESVLFMAREILVLRRLDHPNVMKLDGLVTSRVSGNIYLVFEYMEHDLASLAASPMVKFTEPQVKCYMQQLLLGLEHCHSRGVLHRDIKSSNLLIDNNGNLKIGDFGLATFFCSNQKQPLTSRVVTLWYRPPELLLGSTDYGVAVDLWSAGCILAELFAGRPIMPGRTEVEQLHKIFKLCGSPSEEYWKNSKLPHATIFKPQQPYKRCLADTFKDFSFPTLELLDSLLAIEPDKRGSTSSALEHEFFTTMPLPCDRSSLPKYQPIKELDTKFQDEGAGRQRAAGGQLGGVGSHRNESRESKAVPAPDANAELQASIQKWLRQVNTKSNSEKYNPEEDGGTGFPIEPSRGSSQNGLLHDQSMQPGPFGASLNVNIMEDGEPGYSRNIDVELKTHISYRPQGASAHLSRFSNSLAAEGSSLFDVSTDSSVSNWPEQHDQQNDAESYHHLLGGKNNTCKKDGRAPWRESKMGYASKKNQIHYSGPLFPPGENIDEMLKEHEKQIQDAFRKARIDKTKTKTKKKNDYGDNMQMEFLLQ